LVNCQAVLPGEGHQGYRVVLLDRRDDPVVRMRCMRPADGIRWAKPNLGLIEWKMTGSKSNNLVGQSGSVMYTPADHRARR
jgi:hypothetical protein